MTLGGDASEVVIGGCPAALYIVSDDVPVGENPSGGRVVRLTLGQGFCTEGAPDFGWAFLLDSGSKAESTSSGVARKGELLSIQCREQLAKGGALGGSSGRREVDGDRA